MLLDMALLVAAVLPLVGLAGALAGWWRHRRQAGDAPASTVTGALPPPMPPSAPVVVADLVPMPPSLVPDELLMPGFADTCADWARQITPMPGDAHLNGPSRVSLSDWSAPPDRVELDSVLDPDSLSWAQAPLDALEDAPAVGKPMSCTIAPQAHPCA